MSEVYWAPAGTLSGDPGWTVIEGIVFTGPALSDEPGTEPDRVVLQPHQTSWTMPVTVTPLGARWFRSLAKGRWRAEQMPKAHPPVKAVGRHGSRVQRARRRA